MAELTTEYTIGKRVGPELVTDDQKKYDSICMSIKILKGMSFEDAAKEYGVSKPAIHKRFRLTIVNHPFKVISYDKTKDIKILRERWNNFGVSKKR